MQSQYTQERRGFWKMWRLLVSLVDRRTKLKYPFADIRKSTVNSRTGARRLVLNSGWRWLKQPDVDGEESGRRCIHGSALELIHLNGHCKFPMQYRSTIDEKVLHTLDASTAGLGSISCPLYHARLTSIVPLGQR